MNTQVARVATLRHLAINGAVWTFLGYGIGQFLRLVVNLVMTHLLAPELFGLMALTNVFLIGLNLFSDIGIGPSIIRSSRGEDPTFLNTAWTVQVLRGGLLWLSCVAIAWPISLLYQDHRLLWLLPVVGLTTLIGGFNSTELFSLSRKLSVKQLTLFDVSVQMVALPVMIIWAWLSPTIWALVAGNVASAFTRLALSHRINKEFRNQFSWEKEAFQELFSFGKWIFLGTAMTFLAAQTDKLLLGKLLTFHELGIYTVAFFLADAPKQIFIRLSDNVIFPVISKKSHLSRDILRQQILPTRKLLLLGIVGLSWVLVGFGDLVITELYDARYQQAASMFTLIALGTWPTILSVTIDPALLAVGKSHYAATGSSLKFAYLAIGLPVGFHLGGLLGAVTVVASSDLPFYLFVSYGLIKEKLNVLYQDLVATAWFVGVLILIMYLRADFGFASPLLRFH